jgi:four helix bundle protein
MHSLSRKFPAIERYELASQLRRAAFSVPVNIVEGLGRHGAATSCISFRSPRHRYARSGIAFTPRSGSDI